MTTTAITGTFLQYNSSNILFVMPDPLPYATPVSPPRSPFLPFLAVLAYTAVILPTFWATLLLESFHTHDPHLPEAFVIGSIAFAIISAINGTSFAITLLLRTHVFRIRLCSKPILLSLLCSFLSTLAFLFISQNFDDDTLFGTLLVWLTFLVPPILSAFLITTKKHF